jgi:hypothetical protein
MVVAVGALHGAARADGEHFLDTGTFNEQALDRDHAADHLRRGQALDLLQQVLAG